MAELLRKLSIRYKIQKANLFLLVEEKHKFYFNSLTENIVFYLSKLAKNQRMQMYDS